MKASPSQIFDEAQALKISLSGDGQSSNDVFQKRQELCHLYESLLLIDLDYALDKKVEQDLWSFIFRNPISACQSKAREHKKSNHSYSNSQLSTLLETASGFYLQLLQKLCCAYDIDIPSHPRDSVFGLTKEWDSRYPVARQPRKSSLFYICQHCLVHLGDIARYRGQSLQAETFYRHAVGLVPSNGQPYNQLALLEAASGEKLSTVFYYVRSLCVQHPFPLAGNNLRNLFSKMSSDGSGSEGKSRMTAFEYVSVFLQFHALTHLQIDLKKTDSMVQKLTTSLPALIIAEKFESWQLLQMVAVCLFAIEKAWGLVQINKNKNKKNIDKAMLNTEELKASSQLEELLASMLHAFLLPVHAFLDSKETASYYTLPSVKIILDWLIQDPPLLQHDALTKNPQVWHGLCKLLNDLDATTKEPFDLEKFDDVPLPEDWDFISFLPLKKSQKRLKFNLSISMPNDEESMWLRSVRLCKLGECLAGVTMEGMNLLSMSQSDGKRVFKAVHQTESLTEEVLQQIQELTVNPSPSTSLNDTPTMVNGSTSLSEVPNTSLRSKPCHGEGVLQQEVRFKLDDIQPGKEKSEVEKEILSEKSERRSKDNSVGTSRERRSGRQNVAMQTILQQRAAQISSTTHGRGLENTKDNNGDTIQRQNCRSQNHVDNSHHIRPNPEGCLVPQVVKEVNINRPVHHVSSEQYNQFQQQAHSVSGVQQCDRNETWIQQFNIHQAGITPVNQVPHDNNPVASYVPNALSRVVRAPAPSFNFQQQQQPPPQQQSQSNQMIAKQVTPTTFINPPNVLWNYMSFVTPYQQACAGTATQPATQIIMQQGTAQPAQQLPRQQPSFYVMNGTQQELTPIEATSNILHAYRNPTGGSTIIQQQTPEMIRDQVQEHLANQARMWQQENSRNDIATNHLLNQVVGHPVAQTLQGTLSAQQLQSAGASVSSAIPHELSSNTYSLFNSPWPSGITMPRANKETQHNNIDPVFMQSRIQSLWSGPGPSPLERLLEQQKQRRDGATQ
ncbi:protein SMG7 [Trichonephila inaurata madagascariensis]|uniref:Protein SMG7 n=1 Tax=Trichonephila inaurata madagascariensis TaxID=2747483 RepID=A0A8X7C0Y6_9ARAC|nr:protein SMG7 [Trichonephila inaurata madagascariensis]